MQGFLLSEHDFISIYLSGSHMCLIYLYFEKVLLSVIFEREHVMFMFSCCADVVQIVGFTR